MVTSEYNISEYGHQREKTCIRRFANNAGGDQPTHLRSLISTFVIRFLESIISRLAKSKILNFYLVYVAEETDLSLAFSKTLKTGFAASLPILVNIVVIFWVQVKFNSSNPVKKLAVSQQVIGLNKTKRLSLKCL